jgi:phage terminase large subunit
MLACLWAAFDEMGNAYVYREVCAPNLVISAAAGRILGVSERLDYTIAPTDMWGRNRDSGKSQADLFAEYGLPLLRTQNPRVDGWLNVKEWLKPVPDGTGAIVPRLRIFSTCRDLIRCLPLLQHDDKDPSDCATEPHDITHVTDALRYLLDSRPRPAEIPTQRDELTFDDQIDNFMQYGR